MIFFLLSNIIEKNYKFVLTIKISKYIKAFNIFKGKISMNRIVKERMLMEFAIGNIPYIVLLLMLCLRKLQTPHKK